MHHPLRRARLARPTACRSLQGICGETVDFDQGDCFSGNKGMWKVNPAGSNRKDGINSLNDCIARCKCCPRCNFVSFSQAPSHLDCSWYHACPRVLEPPKTGKDYVTVAVSRSSSDQQRCAL